MARAIISKQLVLVKIGACEGCVVLGDIDALEGCVVVVTIDVLEGGIVCVVLVNVWPNGLKSPYCISKFDSN